MWGETDTNDTKPLKVRLKAAFSIRGGLRPRSRRYRLRPGNIMLQFFWQTEQLLQTESFPGGEAQRVLRANQPVVVRVY